MKTVTFPDTVIAKIFRRFPKCRLIHASNDPVYELGTSHSRYKGSISIEGKWTDAQLASAFAEIRKQAGEA